MTFFIKFNKYIKYNFVYGFTISQIQYIYYLDYYKQKCSKLINSLKPYS